MTIYIAYGSNLNKWQMGQRCPNANEVGHTFLNGYSLAFRRGVATIIVDRSDKCPVGLWEVADKDFSSLDRAEGYRGNPGYNSYNKHSMKIMLPSGKPGLGIIYTINPVENNNIKPLKEGYIETVARGYEDFGFDKMYLKKILIRDFGKEEGMKYARKMYAQPAPPAVKSEPGGDTPSPPENPGLNL